MSANVPEASPARMLSGECLCGHVQYCVEDRFVYALNCHCSQCRKATGSAFKPFAGIERTKLSLTKGQEALLLFGDEHGHDVHCQCCGSLLYSVVRNGEYVHVTLGTLTDEPSIRPTAHIFVGSKAPWYTITDELPQHEEFD
ncbi:GFA family protein [Dyella nitratireducens]|nr:GFA family protein [Dyella nitratireducens]